jgi:hypothetical protein
MVLTQSVDLTATDSSGNTVKASQVINVEDTTGLQPQPFNTDN